MSQSKRVKIEIEDVRYLLSSFNQFTSFEVKEENILSWKGLIVPESGMFTHTYYYYKVDILLHCYN